jgi:hypothetical protein
MSIEEDEETIVRFSTRPIQTAWIEEDNKGKICEIYREFDWTINQIIAEFGEKIVNASKVLQRAARAKGDAKIKICHAVYPDEVDPAKRSKMPYLSHYFVKEDKTELRIKGFRSFPFIVPRWTKSSGEKYGRSPGMNALPEAKTLNLMVETTIKGAQKVVDPPLQAPDDGFIGTIRTRPGAINFYRAGSNDRITPIFNDARIDFGFQANEEKRTRIREAFFVDQLRLRDGTPQMTATEVEARIEQAFRFMGPVLGRQQSETLTPMIDRVFEIMELRGMIPPAPQILAKEKIQVMYSSMIARSQRQGEARAIQRTIEQATPFISADPSVLDYINGDEALTLLARINNFPQSILRDQREVQKIRSARQQKELAAVEEQLKSNTADNISKVSPALGQLSGG